MLHLFGFLRTRPAPAAPRYHQFRPRVEEMEAREVLSASPLLAPALAPALVSTASTVQEAVSLFPIQVNSVSITGLANNTLSLVANATTPNGVNFQIPLTLVNTTPNAAIPILDLHIGEIHLDVLGLKVDTSEICLRISAQTGPGNLLGNLLGSVASLLDQGLTLDQFLSGLSPTQQSDLSSGLSGLINGAFSAIGSPTDAATGGTSVTSTGTTQILNLSLGPVDLNLLGLQVELDNCDDGPVTVAISAESGPGKLLGNLLGGLSHLLDGNANANALINKLEKIAGRIANLL
jgi:hypothetical protein